MEEDRHKIIQVNVAWEESIYKLETTINEYRNLMMMIYDRISPDDFGECLGMGKCGTCAVMLIDQPNTVDAFERNEMTTLKRMGITNSCIRLSCQLEINDRINGLTFKIIQDDYKRNFGTIGSNPGRAGD